jgi:hypothetical protein
MQAPDPIETILSRLMPPALSQDGQFEIDAMIDELAAPEQKVVAQSSSGRWMVRAVAGGGIAASVAGLLALISMSDGFPGSEMVKVAAPVHEFTLVSESDRVESMTDEGWQEDLNGSAVHALRLVAVEENHVKDTESGMVMMISETREEILYSPINAF